jgi:hypothetical protein
MGYRQNTVTSYCDLQVTEVRDQSIGVNYTQTQKTNLPGRIFRGSIIFRLLL